MNDAPPDMDELLDRARALLTQHEVDRWLATRSEVRMAGTIRDLLAEVERLQTFAKEKEARMFFWRSRAETAEAKLRELASAEPVAVVDREAVGRVFWLSIIPDGTLLIPRPEMPS